jgi:phenylalanyl-tRNA synthetase beta chain
MSLAACITGDLNETGWNTRTISTDLYSIKGIAEVILKRLGLPFSFVESKDEMLEQVLELNIKAPIGKIGMVKKSVLKQFDLTQPVFYLELDWDKLCKRIATAPIKYTEIPKFPSVQRDLALLLKKEIRFQQLEQIAYQAERKLLKEVKLFDVYEGEKIQADMKSYALSFTLQHPDSTLTDQQIEAAMDRILKAFEKEAGAILRNF